MSLARANGAAPAAPAGGARHHIMVSICGRGRGCGIFANKLSGMSFSLNTLIAGLGLSLGLGLGLPAPLRASDAAAVVPAVALPSGEAARLQEVLLDPDVGAEGLWARFRFVIPGLGRDGSGHSHAEVVADMDHLCARLVVPYLRHHDVSPERVVVSLADRDLPFGQAAPEAVQFFEVYRLDGDLCIWEGL